MKAKQNLKKVQYYFPEIILILSFIVIQTSHFNIDFWNDEIYTLKHFTFSSLSKTLTDYHVPNNHIAFNLINNIYLKILHIDSLYTLMDHPYILRIIPLIYSSITVLYSYKITKILTNKNTAIIATITLLTLIPYFNFSLQIRGYGISTLCLILLFYHNLRYHIDEKKINLILNIFFSFTAFITIPSNIYYLIGINLSLVINFFLKKYTLLKSLKSINIRVFFSSPEFNLIIATSLGIVLGLLFYLPILKDVFMNEYVIPGKPFSLFHLWYYIKNLAQGYISGKWILIPLTLLSIIITWKNLLSKKNTILSITTILFTPILITFVRGDDAPLRVFVVSMPFYSIFLAIIIYSFIEKYSYKKLYSILSIYAIIGYSLLTFNFEYNRIKINTADNISKGKRSQNLYEQYYSFHYTPLKDSKLLSELYPNYSNAPIIRIGCEPHGISIYLEKFNIPMYNENKYDSLISHHDSLIVITNNLNLFTDSTKLNSVKLNKTASYHNLFLIYKIP